MPTPMRVEGQPVRFAVVAVMTDISPPEKELGGSSREGPPQESGQEEACDKRSGPQDVTSSAARRGGADLQQEVEPQQTERPPRDSSFEDTPAARTGVQRTYKQSGPALRRCEVCCLHAPAPQLGSAVRT